MEKRKEKTAGGCMRISMLAVLFCLFLAVGCGKTSEKGAPGTQGAGSGSGNVGESAAGVSPAGGKTMKKGQLFLLGYCALPPEEAEEGVLRTLYYDTCDGKLYLLAVYEKEGRETASSLYLYDGETGIWEESPFSAQAAEDCRILSMDALPDGILSFRLRNDADETESLLRTDTAGNVLSREDPFPDKEDYPWNPDPAAGDLRKVFDLADGTVVSRTEEGQGTMRISWLDRESGSRETLGVLDGEAVSALCGNGENSYYCIVDGRLIRWNTEDDSRIELMALHEKGLQAARTGKGNNLLRNAKGEIIFCDAEGDMPGIYIFSESRPQEEKAGQDGETGLQGEVRMAYLAHFGMEYVEKMATRFCIENRGCSILVEQADEDSEQEAFRDRIFMELAAGKGPELMWVFEEDLRLLHEKGLLTDLEPWIPEKTRQQIFPGVLEACTLDGRLEAVTPEISFDALIVPDAVWERDGWTRTEFLELLEKNRGTVEWPVTYFSNRLNYYSLLHMVLLTDYSGFIDWERGSCSFDSEEFRRILEVCKEYGKPDQILREEDERIAMLKDGRSLAAIDTCSAGLSQFSQSMKMYGEDCHIAGFPTAVGGDRAYLQSSGYLVVNANASNEDLIGAFLAYLWDYDNQYNSWVSVRRDVSWDKVIVDENTGKAGLNWGSAKDPVIAPLDTKPDGSTYQREYMKLLENCVPRPVKPQAVDQILNEELAYYFEGDKSAEEVARIIQNRVQLYLNERK